ncbi:MAG: S9 family peptidase [Candidatus Eremiobacteraeota bacterium]|nr:S9 family peptidase [Candidatus Eremiobacteraeota bacterium]
MRRFLAASSMAVILLGATALRYPAAPKDGTVDTYYGRAVADPYRPLESIDSPEVVKWVQAEQQVTRDYLDGIPVRDTIAAHLKNIANYERVSPPYHVKNQYFFSRNTGLQKQSVLYTMNGPHGTPRVLIDPNALSADGTVALGGSDVSWNAKYIAYATQTSGSDWLTWHVRDIATGKDLPDVLNWSKFGGAAWLPDNESFLYPRYAEPAPGQERKAAASHQKIYLHRLGTPQSADTLVFARPDHPLWYLNALVSEDERYVVLTTNEGTSPNNRVFYIDLRDPKRTVHAIFDSADANYTYLDNAGSTFYFQTSKRAPRGRVIALDLGAPSKLRTVVPQGDDALQSVSTSGRRFFTDYSVDVHSAIKVYDYAGHYLRSVVLPGPGDAAGFGGWHGDKTVYYSFSSYTTPTSIYAYDISSGRSTLYRKPRVDFDASQFVTKEAFYQSKDGTRIPLWVMYRKGLKLDGNNPTILYAYGGFDIPITPSFSTFRATWLQMGGVYAVANIRGGSEYGEAWHESGMLANKQNVFDDFIAAAQYLIDNKYTSTPKLAINGASNGGLLIGAVEVQRPDLFGAAVPQVGVLDMLRFDKFTVGNGWIPEYGCATCGQNDFNWLMKYSPLQNVKAASYPATLIMTADHDDRVFPAHSFKFAATMQAKQTGDAPVLLRIESKAGHGGGTPITKSIEQYADIYSFLVKNLNMDVPADFK